MWRPLRAHCPCRGEGKRTAAQAGTQRQRESNNPGRLPLYEARTDVLRMALANPVFLRRADWSLALTLDTVCNVVDSFNGVTATPRGLSRAKWPEELSTRVRARTTLKVLDMLIELIDAERRKVGEGLRRDENFQATSARLQAVISQEREEPAAETPASS